MSIFAPTTTAAPDTSNAAPDTFDPAASAYAVLSGQPQQPTTPNLPAQQAATPTLATQAQSNSSKLASIASGVLDFLAPKTKPGLDANGQITQQPQSTGQRIAGAIGAAARGAIAGAAQRGPGAVGRAGLAGMQEQQQVNAQQHQDLMDRANLAFRNNEWLLRQREFDLHSEEFQKQVSDSDNAIQEKMDELGAQPVVIRGPGGKDINGTSDEAGIMAWRTQNPEPPGYHYLPTSSIGKDGKRTYTIHLVPTDALKQEVHLSEDEVSDFGLPPKDGGYFMPFGTLLAFQQKAFHDSGGEDSLKRYMDKFGPTYKLPNDAQSLRDDADQIRAGLQFVQQHPRQAQSLGPMLQAAGTAIHNKMQEQGLYANPEAAAVGETGKKAAATGEQQKNLAEAGKAQFEVAQLKRDAASIQQPDVTGFTPTISKNEYDKRYDSFSKSKQMGTLQTLQGSYQQFQDTVANIQKTGSMTGAESVVGLFNAIGISATPLAGKGFRINAVTVQEHAEARGLGQAAYQKLLSLKAGDIITPKQLTDYSDIASQVYHHAFVNAADEAHRQGLPADFLPKGGGAVADPVTMRIYRDAVHHANPKAGPAEIQKALEANGWRLQ